MPRFPQVKENLALPGRMLPESLVAEVSKLNDSLDGHARVLVRRSGTEPVVRLLAEAPTEAEAEKLCGTIASLVKRELG
jgi:phosphoglucosamine mutase